MYCVLFSFNNALAFLVEDFKTTTSLPTRQMNSQL